MKKFFILFVVCVATTMSAQDSGEGWTNTQYEQYFLDSNDYCGTCGSTGYWRALIFGGEQSNPQIRATLTSNNYKVRSVAQDLFIWIDEKDVMRWNKDKIVAHIPFEVNGRIRAKSLLLENQNWADYVFEDDYNLMPLYEVEDYINKNRHLPGIPSADKVLQEGIAVEEVNEILLRKIEELTLYVIDLEKRVNSIEK